MVKSKNHIAIITAALQKVMDPEIPVLSVIDLGIITNIHTSGNKVSVTLTPTFSGCPALEVMKKEINEAIINCGYDEVSVKVDYSEPWTTNKLSATAKEKLKKFGLGTPEMHSGEVTMEMVADATCPYCGSDSTSLQSPFGSALCRSIHYCHQCHQTFERFKPVA